jgi:hypothetical protein
MAKTVTVPVSETSAAVTKPASGPSAPTRGSGKAAMPAGWGDTTKETQWVNDGGAAFGSITMEKEDQAVTEVPFDAVATHEPRPGETTVQVEEDGGFAKETAPEPSEDPTAPPEKAAKPVEKAPETAPETPVLPPETPSLMRRKALDALRIEGENRALQARLRAEQDQAKQNDLATKAELERFRSDMAKLKSAPLAERLKAIGIETADELFQAGITGEVTLPKERAAPPPVEDPRVGKLEAELNQLRIDSQIRSVLSRNGSLVDPATVMQQAEALWRTEGARQIDTNQHAEYINRAINSIITNERTTGTATKAIRDAVANPEVHPAPYVRATEGALDAVAQVALDMWKNAGAKDGDFAKYAQVAIESAEDMYRERYAPIIAAAGGTVAQKATVAAKPAAVAQRPAPPIGKRIASRSGAMDDDEGPMDPTLRNIWIKDQMRKGGGKGW